MDHRGETTQVSFIFCLQTAAKVNRFQANIARGAFLPARLKAALARRTGRSEEELCFEERRRSARVAEEENHSLEESSLILERGNLRARREETKLSDVRVSSGGFRVTVCFLTVSR